MNDLSSLLEQLHDIEGVGTIDRWPLAIGWWIGIVLGIFILLAAGWLVYRRLAFKRSWKYDTLQKLSQLEKNLFNASSEELKIREIVILFSEYMRRIAMKRFARKECAGLVGEDWLQWLSQHDEKKFDWKEKGRCLIQAPYAPINQSIALEQVKDLIQAAKEWVH